MAGAESEIFKCARSNPRRFRGDMSLSPSRQCHSVSNNRYLKSPPASPARSSGARLCYGPYGMAEENASSASETGVAAALKSLQEQLKEQQRTQASILQQLGALQQASVSASASSPTPTPTPAASGLPLATGLEVLSGEFLSRTILSLRALASSLFTCPACMLLGSLLAGVYEHSCVGLEWGYHYQCVCGCACVHVGVYACMSVGSRGSSQCLILLLLQRVYTGIRFRASTARIPEPCQEAVLARVYTADTIRVTMRIAAFCFCSIKMTSNCVVTLCKLLLSSRGTPSSSNSSQSSLRRRGRRARRRLSFQRQLQLREKAVLLIALTTAIAVGFVPRPRTVWTLQR